METDALLANFTQRSYFTPADANAADLKKQLTMREGNLNTINSRTVWNNNIISDDEVVQISARTDYEEDSLLMFNVDWGVSSRLLQQLWLIMFTHKNNNIKIWANFKPSLILNMFKYLP